MASKYDAQTSAHDPLLLARLTALDREVDERRQVEAQLRAQGDQLRYALSAAGMAVWRVAFDGSGAATWAPLPCGESTGLPLVFVQDGLHNVHDDDRSRLLEHLERSRATGDDFAHEFRSRPVDGRSRWLEVRARMIKDEAGSVSGALGVSTDITERKLIEEQLGRAQELAAVGRLAGGLAHDFNNVLTAVLGYTNLLARSLGADDPRRNDVDQIVHAAGRAAALTRRLLSLSRPQTAQPVALDVNLLVNGVGPHQRVATPAAHGTETVLVVEDERAVRFLTRTVLEQAGYRVIEAVNAREAESVLRSGVAPIDIMIADVIMPGETGPDCVRRLSGSFPGLKVLFMSGCGDDNLTQSGVLEAGAAFLQKPFTAAALAERVRQVLDT